MILSMSCYRLRGATLQLLNACRSHRLWQIFTGVLLLAALMAAVPAAGQDGRRLRAGYTAISGNMLPLWAAREGGYFKKHGLDFDLISMPSGNEG